MIVALTVQTFAKDALVGAVQERLAYYYGWALSCDDALYKSTYITLDIDCVLPEKYRNNYQ